MSRAVNQQPTYTQIFLWCIDAVGQNRGIMYNSWFQESKVTVDGVEEDDNTAEQIPAFEQTDYPALAATERQHGLSKDHTRRSPASGSG